MSDLSIKKKFYVLPSDSTNFSWDFLPGGGGHCLKIHITAPVISPR
jgi:hypothetical protein